MAKKLIGIVGSYRKNGTIDALVSAALTAAQEQGAQTEKIYLLDQNIGFCTNCRACTQKPGEEPGECVQKDDMAAILAKFREADGLVLGAPVNCFNLNALFRRFMERLLGFYYWPWGAKMGPVLRKKDLNKKAVLITACAMPAIIGRFFTGAVSALKLTAKIMGARPVAVVFAGLTAVEKDSPSPPSALAKARAAGRRLAKP
jgi:multimeric flavodoxin WrbA